VAPVSGHPNESLPLEQGVSYHDEPYFNKNQKDKNFWKGSQQARYQTPRNKFNMTEPIQRIGSGVGRSRDKYARNQMGKTQDFITRNETPVMNYQRPAKKYDKFLNNRGRGIRMNRPASPRMYKNEGSQKSMGNGVGKPLQSVKSMQPQMYLNKYEDDCLYMNLEEEYLHRVSKRQGKSTNVSINRSMYNFK
jgi:hypothetical protein